MLRADVRLALREFDLDVRLAVEPGRCLALAGPSGAGKTTVLRAVAGLAQGACGMIRSGDQTWLDTERGVDRPPEARACGLVFQDYALFPHLSAWRNVAYGLPDAPRRGRRREAVALLDRLGAAGVADVRPAALSGGERQRVALARALARRPAVLLLDEPLAALDPRTRGQARTLIAEVVRESEIPAVLVTHDFTEAAIVADTVAVIDRGRVLQEGAAGDLAAAPASAFVAEMTGASVLTGVARPGGDGLTEVVLPGGATLVSSDAASGPVSAVVRPWDVALDRHDPAGSPAGSSRNHLVASVKTLTPLGNHVRVGLALPEPLSADVTAAAAAGLGLAPGESVVATFKATATRLLPR